MDFITFGILVKTYFMKLKFSLLLFCLLGIGVFSQAQDKKKVTKPTIVNEPEEIPVSVTSSKKAKHLKPPPPPPKFDKQGKPMPPTKIEEVKFTPPKIEKDKQPLPPPPPPVKAKTNVSQPEKSKAPPKDLRA
jgi:hypothetical protein